MADSDTVDVLTDTSLVDDSFPDVGGERQRGPAARLPHRPGDLTALHLGLDVAGVAT